jgi:hypothetical protein
MGQTGRPGALVASSKSLACAGAPAAQTAEHALVGRLIKTCLKVQTRWREAADGSESEVDKPVRVLDGASSAAAAWRARSTEKLRPIALPTCTTSLAAPSWSARGLGPTVADVELSPGAGRSLARPCLEHSRPSLDEEGTPSATIVIRSMSSGGDRAPHSCRCGHTVPAASAGGCTVVRGSQRAKPDLAVTRSRTEPRPAAEQIQELADVGSIHCDRQR